MRYLYSIKGCNSGGDCFFFVIFLPFAWQNKDKDFANFETVAGAL